MFLRNLLLGAAVFTAVSFGQSLTAPADAVQQQYLANVSVYPSSITLFNAGANDGSDATGTITAQVYVFDAVDEQLVACCSFKLTPDQSTELNGIQLVINTLTPLTPGSITIKVVGTKGGTAATDQRSAGSPGFSSGLRAWRTTTHGVSGVGLVPTENKFSNVTIADSEYSRMVTFCNFILLDGSGYGNCNARIAVP